MNDLLPISRELVFPVPVPFGLGLPPLIADAGSLGRSRRPASKEKTQHALIIVKRPRALPRFEPLPRRWVIERTFGWMIKNRRLVRDFEQRTDVAETLIRIAATATMLRRVT